MYRKTILFIFMSLAIFGCRHAAVSEMVFEDISFIQNFPETHTLGKGEILDLTQIGIRDLFVYDTLMFVSSSASDGLISVYTLPECEKVGSFFRQGNGPGELLYAPFFTNYCISECSDATNVLLADGKGHLLKWDISSLSADGKPEVSVMRDSLPMGTFYTVYVNDSTFLHRNINSDNSGQERYMMVNGEKHIIPSMEKLNEASIPIKGDPYLFNIMSSFVKYNQHHNMVVEASMMLNTINMYTLDGSFEKTICIGKKADDIDSICSSGLMELEETFTRIILNDNFFAAMYSGGGMITEGTVVPKIYLFNWDGSPKVEIRLEEPASCFDIDCSRGLLYTLDRASEIIRKYDISNLIN